MMAGLAPAECDWPNARRTCARSGRPRLSRRSRGSYRSTVARVAGAIRSSIERSGGYAASGLDKQIVLSDIYSALDVTSRAWHDHRVARHSAQSVSNRKEAEFLKGIDVLESLASQHRKRWTPSQQELSDRCEGWLEQSKFARQFFRWLGANPGLLQWAARTGKKEAASGVRVSIPSLYERLRSRGATGVAAQPGAFRFSNNLKSPLNWAFGFAYPDLAEQWDLKLHGPQASGRRQSQ